MIEDSGIGLSNIILWPCDQFLAKEDLKVCLTLLELHQLPLNNHRSAYKFIIIYQFFFRYSGLFTWALMIVVIAGVRWCGKFSMVKSGVTCCQSMSFGVRIYLMMSEGVGWCQMMSEGVRLDICIFKCENKLQDLSILL